jgi:hypothetical protein
MPPANLKLSVSCRKKEAKTAPGVVQIFSDWMERPRMNEFNRRMKARFGLK